MKRNQKPKICDHCGKTFKSGAGVALHYRSVTGQQPRGEYTEKGLEARRKSLAKVREKSPSHQKKGQRIALSCRCGKIFQVTPGSAGYRKYCSKSCNAKYRVQKPMSLGQKEQISQTQKARFAKDPASNPFYGRTPTNYQGWGHGQFVKELGFWVRSTWERDYLLALFHANVIFQYEPIRFDLLEGRGTYCPDIQLDQTYVFIEITGWDKPEKIRKRALWKEIYEPQGYSLYVVADRPTIANQTKFVNLCQELLAGS